MAKRKGTDFFEIVVVVAIVAIVAFTGQVLIYFDSAARASASSHQSGSQGSLISGYVVANDAALQDDSGFTDISVERIEVDPASPLIGDPFEVKVILKNVGMTEIKTPFYVSADFAPQGDESLTPLTLQAIMPKILKPGEEGAVSFLVSTIVPEGPMRITAHADISGKLDDGNTANNQLSKTLIIAVE